jgi:hypothetical protein
MTDIASFSARLDLDEATVRRVLESESSAAGRSMPWYVLLLLGLGAWITALIMIVFVAVFLDFVVGLDEPRPPPPPSAPPCSSAACSSRRR